GLAAVVEAPVDEAGARFHDRADAARVVLVTLEGERDPAARVRLREAAQPRGVEAHEVEVVVATEIGERERARARDRRREAREREGHASVREARREQAGSRGVRAGPEEI